MKVRQDIAVFLLRTVLAAGFLSAVSSRLNLWGAQSSGWSKFVRYTAEVNSFLPYSWIPSLAVLSTIAESSIGILLLIGYRVRKTALCAAILTVLFGIAMSISFGCKEPLDYSVFVFSAGAFLLSTFSHYIWSLDQLLHQ
ncbi:DoxX family membrane protein [Elizabethkingia miricola]|uniref:DoxX family membrane protein n=1 Tax=Elizabethkingia miricola TaxID=172045 RepID=UPI000B34CAF4|nr:DoxX family protein [Elizabethkingia miricola]NHQ68246.1 DoxX family protein [Elizabethkingia miricola]NHQ72090.1 DoxX family protein [Elizabethkingia miricola]NHQ79565.1 DoxX family protein [Elizabethkingia miricola]PSL88031.1 DoxX family protein [Elizabethkingia miricola]QHQ86020.1 DoxX family protein [Elizabethkingia miricola]